MNLKTLFLTVFCTIAVTLSFSKEHSTTLEKAIESAAPSLCFFMPPQGWEIADPGSLSPRVKIAFLKNTGKGFCPSINLAVEETSVCLNDYLKAVRAIHEQDRSTHWRALGKVRTAAGLAQLTEIDSTTEWGPIRILQLIFLKDGHAYVLTAAALKEEFSNFYTDIQSSFRSMTLSSDLLSNIPQLERREALKHRQLELMDAAAKILATKAASKNLLEDALFQKKYWIPFQQAVMDGFHDMGAFWQVLMLRNTQEKLLSFSWVDPSFAKQLENK
jgi:hypothetical protein